MRPGNRDSGQTAPAAPTSRPHFGLALLAALLSACAAFTTANVALDAAQTDYKHAQSSEELNLLAGRELAYAGEALSEAHEAWARHAGKERVDQLAALVTQRVVLARAKASQRVDELRQMTRMMETEAKP